MNQVSPLFQELFTTFQHDATSPRVEELAADIAARVGAEETPLCVGIVSTHLLPCYYGLGFLLAGYGVSASHKPHPSDARFIFLGRDDDEMASEWEGATVLARAPHYEVVA